MGISAQQTNSIKIRRATFTFQDFHEPIIVRARNKDALRDNCLRCHSDFLYETQSLLGEREEVVNCIHCHRTAGHGETTGLGRFEPTASTVQNNEN